MNINPSTMKIADSRRKLVFDIGSMKFVSLARGQKLTQNIKTMQNVIIKKSDRQKRQPLTGKLITVKKGERLIQNPLKPTEYFIAKKLVFRPDIGQFIPLRKGEKLRLNYSTNQYEVIKKDSYAY